MVVATKNMNIAFRVWDSTFESSSQKIGAFHVRYNSVPFEWTDDDVSSLDTRNLSSPWGFSLKNDKDCDERRIT